MNKVDIEKAYRRLHISGDMAAKTIATWHLPQDESDEDIAVALGRLPFGSVKTLQRKLSRRTLFYTHNLYKITLNTI